MIKLQLALTQDAYFYCNGSDEYYRAQAYGYEDRDLIEYVVRWDIKNPDADEEADACDWAEYSVYRSGTYEYVGNQDDIQLVHKNEICSQIADEIKQWDCEDVDELYYMLVSLEDLSGNNVDDYIDTATDIPCGNSQTPADTNNVWAWDNRGKYLYVFGSFSGSRIVNLNELSEIQNGA